MKGKAAEAKKMNQNKHLRCFTQSYKRKRKKGDRKMMKIKEVSAEAKCHGGNANPIIFSN